MTTEKLLYEQLKQGNEQAFRLLVDQWYPNVLKLSMNYLHDTEEAEDIAQDVFVEIYESIGQFRGDSAISTWIYRITVNKALNRRKRIQRKNLLFPRFTGQRPNRENTSGPEPIDPHYKSPQALLEQKDDRLALSEAINKLPAQQRTAFLLSKTENMSYKEIADIMETSIPSVESLLFRAKTNLRKYLNHYIRQKF